MLFVDVFFITKEFIMKNLLTIILFVSCLLTPLSASYEMNDEGPDKGLVLDLSYQPLSLGFIKKELQPMLEDKKYVDFSCCEIGDKELKAILRILPLDLIKFELTCNQITDVGFDALVKHLQKQRELSFISINMNEKISGDNVKYWIGSKHNKHTRVCHDNFDSIKPVAKVARNDFLVVMYPGSFPRIL